MKRLFILSVAVVLLSSCAHSRTEAPISLLGDPAPVEGATVTIEIKPETKWVNVTGGDTVKFVAGDKAFAWAFNVGTSISSFELGRVAPPGILTHSVRAYVAPDPRYIGGGDRSN